MNVLKAVKLCTMNFMLHEFYLSFLKVAVYVSTLLGLWKTPVLVRT